MSNWDGDLDDGIEPDEGDTTTRIWDLSLLGREPLDVLFFRIEKG